MGTLIEDTLFNFHGKRSKGEALRLAQERTAKAEGEPARSTIDAYCDAGKVPGAVPFGTFLDGRSLLVPPLVANQTSLTIGAPGSGKTRHILNRIETELRWNLGLPAHGVAPPAGYRSETELLDPKSETAQETKKLVAALYVTADDPLRIQLRQAIRVLDWSATRVTPLPLFHNPDRTISNAFLAHQRVEVEVAASGQTFTDSTQHLYFMFGRFLAEKDYPLNDAYARRFLTDAAFRLRELTGIQDRDLKAYFANLEALVPKQTIEALLRRIQRALAFPEIRAAVSTPYSAIAERFGGKEFFLTIGDFGLDNRLPRGKALERASNRAIDLFRTFPRRDTATPFVLILEEAGYLLSQAPLLADPLANGARTFRALNVGVHLAAQDFTVALPKSLVRTLALNARTITLFQSREEAEWLEPFADELPGFTGTSAQRRAALVREIQNLPSRNAYFYAKGLPPVRFVTLPFPSASERAGGMPDAELLEVFEREVAPASTIPIAAAEEAIAQWEAAVLGSATAAEARPKRPRGIADLLSDLEDEEP